MAISSTRLVFLSTGKYTSTAKYTRFSKANLDLLSHATGFVISVTGVYSIYGNGPYTDLINDVMSQVEVVAQTKKPFYIGLPAVNFFSTAYTTRTADYQRIKTQYVIPVWEKISANSNYKSLFKGFYFTNERVFGSSSASSPTSNAQIGLMNDLAYTIRNDPNANIRKEFIWSPYLGYNASYYEINNNIGIVANRTNIFNTIFLQSHYYFTAKDGVWNGSSGVIPQNLELAIKCATENKFYNFAAPGNFNVGNAIIVSGSKTSSTKIALNMEAEDGLKWSQSSYAPYYRVECEKMREPLMSNSCPFVFYAGSYNGIISAGLYKTIEGFYTNGNCVLP